MVDFVVAPQNGSEIAAGDFVYRESRLDILGK
jgi:hypothetical protein